MNHKILDDGVRNLRRFIHYKIKVHGGTSFEKIGEAVQHDGERVLIFYSTVKASIDPWVASEADQGLADCMLETLKEANYVHATGLWDAPAA